MKKRFIALALCVCTAFSMAACGKGKTDTKSSEGSIKLGEYKGYTVGESVTQVDSADVDEYINSILKMYSSTNDVKEGTTAEGDKVNVPYRATVRVWRIPQKERRRPSHLPVKDLPWMDLRMD